MWLFTALRTASNRRGEEKRMIQFQPFSPCGGCRDEISFRMDRTDVFEWRVMKRAPIRLSELPVGSITLNGKELTSAPLPRM